MTYRFLLTAALALAACHSPDNVATAPTTPYSPGAVSAAPHHGVYTRAGEPLPFAELQKAKTATARYRDLNNALKDGYHDIGVVLPNMGRHFLKDGLLDGKFEAEHPELLVYTPDTTGHQSLVAVEYAVPLNLSATAPEGFQGNADEWFPNQQFQLWTLHAWLWKENPDGIFNPTNIRTP